MKISILGAGKSGLSAARLALRVGDTPFVSEYVDTDLSFLANENIPYEVAGHTDRVFDCDLLVLSPGINPLLPIVQSFNDRKIPVVSEIEYAFRNSNQSIIGITGSNGKTTTTTLLGDMLESFFGDKRIAGNIGIPLADVARKNDKDPVVVELSSFQLETIDTFLPTISILLNVSPNHLDRYDSYDDYVNAKLRIYKNANTDSVLIINADDERVLNDTSEFIGKRLLFSLSRTDVDAYIKNDAVYIKIDEEIKIIDIDKLKLSGPHHLMNMMAASLSAYLSGVSLDVIQSILVAFGGLEHRMELVTTDRDVDYINDSKSTSVEALKMALQSYSDPIVLLAGGKHKGASYAYLGELIRKNTKKVFVFGEAKDIMFSDWNEFGSVERVETLFEAVDKAKKIVCAGDKVLLSPACSSFDQFKTYEDRGNQFKEYVLANDKE